VIESVLEAIVKRWRRAGYDGRLYGRIHVTELAIRLLRRVHPQVA
jgi:hypothetical protein